MITDSEYPLTAEYLINNGEGITLAEVLAPGTVKYSQGAFSLDSFEKNVKRTQNLEEEIGSGYFYLTMAAVPGINDPNLPYGSSTTRFIDRPCEDMLTLNEIIKTACIEECKRFSRADVHKMKTSAHQFAHIWPAQKDISALSAFFADPRIDAVRLTKIVREPEMLMNGYTVRHWKFTVHIVIDDKTGQPPLWPMRRQ